MKIDFYLNPLNHPDFYSCCDHLLYLRNGLTRAGHSASLMPALIGGSAVNVVLESFNDDLARKAEEACRTSQMRLVLIASEIVTGQTFNAFGSQLGDDSYGAKEYWRTRYDGFCRVARLAEAIWCLSDQQLDGYRSLLPDKPVETIPFCFDPIDAGCEAELEPEKDFDVLFFGRLTPHRSLLLDALRARVYVCTVTGGVPRSVLHDLIRRARICLHLGISPDWPYTSVLRHHTLLTRGAYVLSEASRIPGELDSYVDICPPEALIDRVSLLLRQPDRLREKARDARQRYAAERPIEDAMRSLVKQSFPANEDRA